MIITQTGVSSNVIFAQDGTEFVVNGVVTNLANTASAAVKSGFAVSSLTNHGTIAAFGAGAAVEFALGGAITNHSVISGVVVTRAGLTYTNNGRHVGVVAALPADALTGATITNTGVMVAAPSAAWYSGTNWMMVLSGAADTVVNRGKIVGDIQLGEGANTFDGRGGTLLGTVYGGGGNDTYYINQATAIVDSGGTDTLIARFTTTLQTGIENLTLGGFGNFRGIGNTANNTLTGNISSNQLDGLGGDDTLIGGKGADTLLGGTNSDNLDGGNGNDLVNGGFGNDTVAGDDGNDTVIGDTGSDLLTGGLGNDVLSGDIGADTMDGGAGDDVLTGGAFGTDVMTGGDGADRFVFASVNDSFATHAADIISDFQTGLDRIDLSALIGGVFGFDGLGPLSGVGPSINLTASVGAGIVRIDLDGNGLADMQIVLANVLPIDLTVGDFIL